MVGTMTRSACCLRPIVLVSESDATKYLTALSDRTQSGPKSAGIDVSAETRRQIGFKTLVDCLDHRLLVASNAAGDRKDRQHPAFVA